MDCIYCPMHVKFWSSISLLKRGVMRGLYNDFPVTGRVVSKCTRVRSLAFCLFLTMAAFAQSDRGTITGTVTDPSSAAIVGAKVEVKNQDTGNTFDAITTQTGSFTIPSVPSGKYNVAISAPGFKTADESGVEVLLNQTVKVDVVLQIGQATETISVAATADMLKTDNAEQSMNVRG